MDKLSDNLKKIFLAGIGAVAVTAEKSKDLLDEMVEKGELTVEQGKVLNEELKHNVKKTVKEKVNALKPASAEELSDLLDKMTPEQIAAEKQVVLRQLEADGDGDLFDRAACDFRRTENGAFPPLGTPESLMALTEADIQLWQEMIFQPQNACLVMTGNFSDGMELAAIEALSELRNTTAQPPFTQSLPIGFCMRDEQSDLLEEVESDFASVQLAFDVDSEQVYPVAAEVLSTITAGNDDSMLFQALREEQALVAEIESQISRVGQFSRLVIRYDVRSEWLKDTLTKVFAYLHRLTMYVRPARLNQLRTQFTTNNAMLTDDTAALNDRLGWAWMSGDTAQADLDAAAAQYNELTAEELLDAAQTVFRPENLTIAVQYDPEAVGDLRPMLQKLRETL